jgi:hypothetical protein
VDLLSIETQSPDSPSRDCLSDGDHACPHLSEPNSVLSNGDEALRSVETAPALDLEPSEEEEEEYLSQPLPQQPSIPETFSSGRESPYTDEPNRETDKDGDSSTNSFSSSRDKMELLRPAAVSFENFEETAFFASRGGGESEFSGPPPKPIEADVPDSQSSDFGSLPAQPFDRPEEAPFDASLGESLFTVSDFPVFDEPPVLSLSTSNEFEEKQKKPVVVCHPTILPSQVKGPEPAPETIRQRFIPSVTETSGPFAFWKARTRKRQRIQERKALSPPSRGDKDARREDLIRNRKPEPGLSDLADKHRLTAQIDRQRDVNRYLNVRLEQIRRETTTMQTVGRSGRPTTFVPRAPRFIV